MRYLLAIPILIVIIWVAVDKCKPRSKSEKVAPLIVKTEETRAATDSLSRKLNETIDSFNQIKPVVEKCIKKMKYQDSLIKELRQQLTDTVEPKWLRIDLHEAKQEIKRLCAPRSTY